MPHIIDVSTAHTCSSHATHLVLCSAASLHAQTIGCCRMHACAPACRHMHRHTHAVQRMKRIELQKTRSWSVRTRAIGADRTLEYVEHAHHAMHAGGRCCCDVVCMCMHESCVLFHVTCMWDPHSVVPCQHGDVRLMCMSRQRTMRWMHTLVQHPGHTTSSIHIFSPSCITFSIHRICRRHACHAPHGCDNNRVNWSWGEIIPSHSTLPDISTTSHRIASHMIRTWLHV